MSAVILDGKATAQTIKNNLAQRVSALKAKGINPGLGTILVGDDAGSHAYVNGKHKDCAEVGISSIRIDLPKTATQTDVMNAISQLNNDANCTGFIVQLPLPKGLDGNLALEAMNPDKDAEGNVIDPKSQIKDSVVPGAYNPETGYLDSGKLAVGAAEVAGGVYAGKKAIDLIQAGRATVPTVPPGSPTPASGFPRGAAPTPSTANLPTSQSKIIVPEGNSPRSSTTMGKGNVFPVEANTAGKRAPLPPSSAEEGIAKKIVERISELVSINR